ncbi:putative myb-like dna-binding domain-containing protein, partial [Golovinomyces cichoracearum]
MSMNTIFQPNSLRSRYRSNYNSNESRRSPRQQSPGRYDISDDFRGGTSRERRRSNPDSRTIKAPFISNRELFHDSMNRESPRNFSREPPRGPKGVPDAPTGPRASSYGDFRNDFSLQSDVRSERGRGRGRSWRDDSRDKGREIERDYRDRRDDRFISSIRDDRSRDRWASHDVYNTIRRPPSPYGRARSPMISQRDPREPQNLELDRTRRGSRDVPLTTGASPSEKPQHLVRGFGKSRGARGRGRTGYYDEFHRIAGPSRSPTETGWNRKTQPSATPPPPVPAFGSASNSITAGSNSPTGTIAITHGLIPGVTVPTAPRSERRSIKAITHSSIQTFNENSNRELKDKHSEISLSSSNTAPRISSPAQILNPNNIKYETDKRKSEKVFEPKKKSSRRSEKKIVPSLEAHRHPAAVKEKSPILKRRPIFGKRSGKPTRILIEDEGNTSDSDSGDDFGDDYFEKEIEKVKLEIDTKSVNNPLLPRTEPKGIFLNVFVQSDILDVIEATEFASLAHCKSFENEVETQSRISTLSPTTPNVSEMGQTKDPKNLLPLPVDSKFPLSQDVASDGLSDIQKRMTGSYSTNFSLKNSHFLSKGRPTSMDLISTDVESNSSDNIMLLDAVRKRMKTPPISTLPRLNCELWFRDLEFLKSLEPNPIIDSNIARHLADISARRKRDQEKERRRWASRYHRYRRFTDRSSDPAAIRSRERFLKSRAKSAAAALSPPSVLASAGSKPKGSRRIGSRFATEHELQRVLLQSEQEAKESKEQKEQKERATRTSTTIAKEAIVPDMLWDKEERDANHFEDRSGLISFERSFARLEFGEPIDNFTKEETISFEKLYFESPKQWGKIAESIPNRDYKSCIQHYYLVKHPSNLKKKLKDHSRKRKGRQSKVKKEKEKIVASINDQGSTRDDEEVPDGQADGRSRRPRRAAAPTFNSELKDQANEIEMTSPIVISTTNIAIPQNNEHNPDTPIDPVSHTPSFSPPTPPLPPATPLIPPPTTSVKRKAKAPREKSTKQAKNNQILTSISIGRRVDSPPTPLALDLKEKQEIEKNAQTGTVPGNASPQQNFTSPLIVPIEQMTSSLLTSTKNSDKASQQTKTPEIVGTVTPSKIDLPQTQKNQQQTSSYWSVPEQDVFSALLGHFGTNWHGIAKFMTTKTHIMVKNHYQRQVDSGKMKEWEIIAKAADEKIERAEPTGPLPLPIVIPTKRCPDIPTSSSLQSGSRTEICDDLKVIPLVSPSNVSNLQPIGLSSQDPSIMCQTSSSLPTKPSIALSKSNKGLQPEIILQAQPLNTQAPRARGPPLGYFDTGPPIRQQQKPEKVSQRTLKAALDAQVERELALRMEKEQLEIQMQKQPQRLQQRQPSQQQSRQSKQPVPMQS